MHFGKKILVALGMVLGLANAASPANIYLNATDSANSSVILAKPNQDVVLAPSYNITVPATDNVCEAKIRWDYWSPNSPISQTSVNYGWLPPLFNWWGYPVSVDNGKAGCVSLTKDLCGGRYTFDKVTTGDSVLYGFVNHSLGNGFDISTNDGNFVRACETSVIPGGTGDIALTATYKKQARVYQYYFLEDHYDDAKFKSTWYPVGSQQNYQWSMLNLENENYFYSNAEFYNGGSSGTTTVFPAGTVHDENYGDYVGNPVHYASEIINWMYNSGNKFLATTASPKAITLPFYRYGHTATLLVSGKVLFVGGMTNYGDGEFEKLLDPTTATWSNVAKPGGSVNYLPAAALLQSGKVLMCGGFDYDTYTVKKAARLYNPVNDTWSDIAPMNAARAGHTATLLQNGKVLVTGGANDLMSGAMNSSTELYDPVTDTWSAAADLPEGRFTSGAVLLPNGKVLVVGGQNSAGTALKSTVIYDPVANGWSGAADMQSARGDQPGLAQLKTRNVNGGAELTTLVVGGRNGLSLETYDYLNDTWTTQKDQLLNPRNYSAATTLADGRVLVSGGDGGYSTVELFELEADGTVLNRREFNTQLVPAFSSPSDGGWGTIHVAPNTGTPWLWSGYATITASPLSAAGETGAQWMPVGWDGGKGRVPSAGGMGKTPAEADTATINLLNFSVLDHADSTIDVQYLKYYRTGFSITGTSLADPAKTKLEQAVTVTATSPGVTGISATAYWTPASGSTITLPEIMVDGGKIWVFDRANLNLPLWAKLSYDKDKRQYVITQSNQFAAYDFIFPYALGHDVTFKMSGVDAADLNLIAKLPGFSPVAIYNQTDNLEYFRTNDSPNLVAPNVIYTGGNGYRYVLTGWAGSGSVVGGNLVTAGMFTTVTATIGGSSSITWIYKKQLRVKVTVHGVDRDLEVIDLPAGTTAGSATVTFPDGVTPPSAGMVVSGFGIPDGTVVMAPVSGKNAVLLNNPASLTYAAGTGYSGQWLTFATANLYVRAADIASGSATVVNVATGDLVVGMSVKGYGIPDGTTIVTVNNDNSILLSTQATQTFTGAAGQRLIFGSADPRECLTTKLYSQANCVDDANNLVALQSGTRFYDLDMSAQPAPLAPEISLTTKQSFTESILRTFSQPIVTGGGSLMTSTAQVVSDRIVLVLDIVSQPVEVDWRYDQTRQIPVGKPIDPPADQDINPNVAPIILKVPDGVIQSKAFVQAWDNPDATNVQRLKYYPVQPMNSFKLRWQKNPKPGELTTYYEETCTSFWYRTQKHIAQAPANLQPVGVVNTFNSISYSNNGGQVLSGVFNAQAAGMSVLRFSTAAKSPLLKPGTAFVVVETEELDMTRLSDAVRVPIGSMITDPTPAQFQDPEGRPGFVFFEGAAYDGAGSDKAYDRAARSGAIIPVNEGEKTPLVVVWYERGQGDLGWPTTYTRYKAYWPDTATITIGDGIDVDPKKSKAQVYNQPDQTLPGFNPNEEHAFLVGTRLYALRDDLNDVNGLSKPNVLLKYFDGVAQKWKMDVYKVARKAAFTFTVDVGMAILPPLPAAFQLLPDSRLRADAPGHEWYLHDRKGGHWAKGANWALESDLAEDKRSRFVMQWYYPMRSDFYWPFPGSRAKNVGDAVPFLNNGSISDPDVKPIDVTYITKWPANKPNGDPLPQLPVGDTLTFAKDGLPDLYDFLSAEIVFDQSLYQGLGPLAKLYAPVRVLSVPLAALPAAPNDVKTELGAGGMLSFPALPYALQARLFYDPAAKSLKFKGVWITADGEVRTTPPVAGDWLLPNLVTLDERSTLLALSSDTGWGTAVNALYAQARNPNLIGDTDYNQIKANPVNDADLTGTWKTAWRDIRLGLNWSDPVTKNAFAFRSVPGEKSALTAGRAQGEGYLVLAENNDPGVKDAPVQLHVLKVSKTPVYQGIVRAIKSKNTFDEKLTLHYTGDFGGEPEKFVFEWYTQPTAGTMPSLPAPGNADSSWSKYVSSGNSSGAGLTDITISGASPFTMSDNWFIARYYYKSAWPAPISSASSPANPATPADDLNNWSGWSGASLSAPMLAMGWIKRVVDGLNPLEARVTNFRDNATNTTVSMISQFGTRYQGDIALNSDAANLNGIGLISAYETVLNRGRQFSIDAQPPIVDYGPANDSLLNISSRLATFYLALGNEAYADAVDPTIGFSTKSAEYGNMAPSVFAFQNQVDSLLEEELALMRGRDDSAGSTRSAPYYNRLIWNFTQGEGEVAYAQNYNITDQDQNGIIDANDAALMYPQGHGDAWGHYLSAITYYYKLLGHPNFRWEPRVEFVTVAGLPIMVDYLDERKFASIAAARSKTGAEILDLTYRKFYTDDPAGQWQGYKDTDAERAWGVDEWARRAALGTYFDWVTANAILPDVSPVQDRTVYREGTDGIMVAVTKTAAEIQQIDRKKVPELAALASQFHAIQARMMDVDQGVNPLGLVKGVVPFDIDPYQVDATQASYSKTHFEQIYERAEKALDNAFAAYDYANGYTQRLRQNQDTLEDFKKNLTDQERDYRNRLIEIFGYPYADDIGAGKTYPDGYDGPDLIHYSYVDRTELTGEKITAAYTSYTAKVAIQPGFWSLGGLVDNELDATQGHEITYTIDGDHHWLAKPVEWSSQRRAPGRVQQTLSDLILAQASYNSALNQYNNMVGDIDSAKENLQVRYGILAQQIMVRDQNEGAQIGLDATINVLHGIGIAAKRASDITDALDDTTIEGLPKVIGVASDVTSPARATIKGGLNVVKTIFDVAADVTDMGEFSLSTVKDRLQSAMELQLVKSDANYEVYQTVKELENMVSDVDQQLLEVYSRKETLMQAAGTYLATLAEGIRLMDEREAKRKESAADVQEYRYQDLGFRVFRNDAIQKFRAQFDLAAKYVYLAATAYDYETNLLATASGAGRKFLTEIGRQRSLGVMSNGLPQAGFPGLADVMARLSQNFAVYKTQLGFNNPQTETTPFSLRTELFRVKADASSLEDWKNVLKDHKVDDLWKIPEFKRYCRPFAPESAGPQPGIVIRFPTTITYGQNFFGWPLSGGDSAYSTSNFSTRIRSVGLWFQNYNNAGLSATPRVYLVPTGADVLRSPTGNGFAIREWQVVDQKLPVPFPIGNSDLKNPSFIPDSDSLSDEYAGIRKVSDFRAYPYGGSFDPGQSTTDSRLIGRSVWNTQWMLIIPGSTLLFNKDSGLNTFINSVDDIKLFFQTYAYSGN